jgi:hypothetical protein
MKELEKAMQPVILRPDRPLADMARAFSSFPPHQVMQALGLDPAIRFDFIVGRDLFTRLPGPDRDGLAALLFALLAPGGMLSFAQVIPRLGQRLSSLVTVESADVLKKLKAAEERVYSDPENDLVCWSHDELAAACRRAGAREVTVQTEASVESRRISQRELDLWLAPESPYGKALSDALDAKERAEVQEAFGVQLVGREVSWTSTVAFVLAQ